MTHEEAPGLHTLADDLLDRVVTLTTDTPELRLRVARLAAWFKRQDVLPLGYSSFAAFARAHLELGASWLRELVRFVEADLPLVHAAVAQGVIPLSVAVKAPRSAEGDEADWLDRARWLRNRRRVELEGQDLRTMAAARDRVRLVLAVPVSDEQADRTMLGWWRDQVPAETLLDHARHTPAVPEFRPMSTAWETPVDLQDGVVQLREAQRDLRLNRLRIGRAWREFAEGGMHRVLGYSSLANLVRENLAVSLRTLQRDQRLAVDIDRYPELAEAVDSGALALRRARLLVDLVDEESVGEWIVIGRRVPLAELREVAAHAGRGDEALWRRAYLEALETADREHATSTGAPVLVSLAASQGAAPVVGTEEVDGDLLAAARWLMETLEIPEQSGTGRVKELEGWCCQNPECRRRSLRVEAHHLVFRSRGGGDELENLVTLCRACHLRLVHTGRALVRRQAGRLVWDLPGRRIVVF